jgi:hypothetical protein
MGTISEFPIRKTATEPDPSPPAASIRQLLDGKCTVRFTLWLTDTLLGRLARIAEQNQTNVSDVIRQSAASWVVKQAILSRTTSDALADLARILPLVIQELEAGTITADQILMACHRMARAQEQMIERRKAA